MSFPSAEPNLSETSSPPLPMEVIMPRDIEWRDAPRIIASGFAMGTADVVPGVSGGTLAVACGIYERLLTSIASINARSLRALLTFQLREALWIIHYRFLLSLFAGLFTAIIVMVKVVGLPRLLVTQTTLVYSVFFGLVFASVFILGKKLKWTTGRAAWFALGALLGFLVVTRVPVNTPGGPLFMFGYGTVAISAMLLPGISGSFILLILGQYQRVIGALESLIQMDFSALWIVVPFALGCLVGLSAFSRFVAWLLRHHHDPVVAWLCGLLIGSLWRIWPYQHTKAILVRGKMRIVEAAPYMPEEWQILPIALAAAGFASVFLVEFLARARNKAEPTASTGSG